MCVPLIHGFDLSSSGTFLITMYYCALHVLSAHTKIEDGRQHPNWPKVDETGTFTKVEIVIPFKISANVMAQYITVSTHKLTQPEKWD